MTHDKYTPFESRLEQVLKGVDANMQAVKGMVASMYGRFDELVDTSEATFKTVTYEPTNARYSLDEDLDFLDEDN